MNDHPTNEYDVALAKTNRRPSLFWLGINLIIAAAFVATVWILAAFTHLEK